MGLIAREIERRGIPTLMTTHCAELTGDLGVPRAIVVPAEMGTPYGVAGDLGAQVGDCRDVLEAAAGLEPGEIATAPPRAHIATAERSR